MAYKLKRNYLINWDVQESDGKSPVRDSQDDYISERSSASSLEERSPSTAPHNSPTIVPPPIPKKEAPNLVYHYNQLPEDGVPLAIRAKQAQKAEKKIRKAPRGQGTLAPVPEVKQSVIGENYFPYWYYYKAKNPDWVMRHRQYADGQIIPYESFDPSQYIQPPAVTTPTKKPHRKSRRDPSTTQYYPNGENYETLPTLYDYPNQQTFSASQYPNPNEQVDPTIRSHSHGKLKTENDWNEHYLQSMTTKSLENSNNQITDSNTSKHHHSKKQSHNSPDENKNHHHHYRRHHHSASHHHRRHHHSVSHHHRHHHHHQHQQAAEYVGTEFGVTDASFKKSERSPFFRPPRPNHTFQLSPPAIYNPSSYLPPITRDYQYRPNLADYSTTQGFDNNRPNSFKPPEIYKPSRQTNFYDRYLNTVITRKMIE